MTDIQKRLRVGRGVALAAVLAAAVGCDFLDPTNVNNPSTTSDDLAQAAEPVRSLLPGLRAQFARAVNATVIVSEVVSDNYSVHGTGLTNELDDPHLSITSGEMNGTSNTGGYYWNAQELRALADFVIDSIAPDDDTKTPEMVQEALYYRGMAFLLQGENFVAAPREKDGAAVAAMGLLDLAIAELDAAIGQAAGGAFAIHARAALARAHRLRGNASEAATAAGAVLAADGNYLFQQEFDAQSVGNGPFVFLFQRALKEMQPLPRLDFLDLKYTSQEAGIAISKAEEMLLIQAEAAFFGGDWTGGRESLAQAVELALTRPTEDFDDDDARLDELLQIRPNDASITIAADAASPFIAGLVLTRPGVITTPTVSATSLDPAVIRATAVTNEAQLLHDLFLARQEILFLEGRRMSDLGIRLPMMLQEIEQNPNITEGSLGTVISVPSFIPQGEEMDLFTPATPYDAAGTLVTTQVTMRWDMNRVLAQQRFSPLGIIP